MNRLFDNLPPKFPVGLMLAIGLIASSVTPGCQRQPVAESGSTPANFRPDLSGAEIWSNLKQHYANLDYYSDRTSLFIRYRLDEQLMEEHYPQFVAFTRPGKIAASVFNARIKSDGHQLSCFIYDFPSHNIDQQRLLLSASTGLPFDRLLSDSIAQHFIGGQSELPVRTLPEQLNALFPPTVKLLTDQVTQPWLESKQIRRLDDLEFNASPCFYIAIEHRGCEYRLAISQSSGMLEFVEYPNALLVPELQQAAEVTDLKLLTRFEQASTQPLPANHFNIEIDPQSKLVERFVAVPEKFPCETIGQPLTSSFPNPRGGESPSSQWHGKTTSLFWMNEAAINKHKSKLIEFKRQLDPRLHHAALILVGDPSGNQLTNELNSAGFQVLLDRTFKVGKQIELRTTPAALVVNPDGIAHYCLGLDAESDWQVKLLAAVARVHNGENLAREMRQSYQGLLDQYTQRLAEASVDAQQTRPHQPYFEFALAWQSDALKMPGNLLWHPQSPDALWALDGFQTVARLDLQGQPQEQRRLTTATGQAISVWRVLPVDAPSQQPTIIGFTPLETRIHLFNHRFDTLDRLNTDFSIGDVQWLSRKRLAVASADKPRLHILDSQGLKRDSITTPDLVTSMAPIANAPNALRSAAATNPNRQLPDVMASLQDGSLVRINLQDKTVREITGFDQVAVTLAASPAVFQHQLNPTRNNIQTGRAGHRAPQADLVVLTCDAGGRWQAVGMANDNTTVWQIPAPPQNHDSPIQPLTPCWDRRGQTLFWAIAGSNSEICLISRDGRIADRMQAEFPIRGLQLVQTPDQLLLVASGDNQLHAWRIRHNRARANDE